MLAGEPERKMMALRLADGFEIDDKTWHDICEAGKKVGVNLN
jgi:LDH2 family malate/lactate/ureidoglycolate dehydrogenase